MVANKRWPEIATWSHTAIGFFPWLTVASILALVAGVAGGGATDYPWFSIDGDWTWSRIAVHGTLGFVGLYIGISWLGAAIGTSPHRSIGTVALAPLLVF